MRGGLQAGDDLVVSATAWIGSASVKQPKLKAHVAERELRVADSDMIAV